MDFRLLDWLIPLPMDLAAKDMPGQGAELAGLVLEVAKVKPYKKRRLTALARERRDLLEKLETTGLILAHHG